MISDSPKEFVIKCQKCSKPLINYLKLTIGENPDIHYLDIKCPFCQFSNTNFELQGNPVYGPIGQDQSNSPTQIADMDFDKASRRHTLTLKLA